MIGIQIANSFAFYTRTEAAQLIRKARAEGRSVDRLDFDGEEYCRPFYVIS